MKGKKETCVDEVGKQNMENRADVERFGEGGSDETTLDVIWCLGVTGRR